MKITRSQLRKFIQEQVATVNDDAIEDVVMDVLSDEGGAAGLEPIEDALEELEDDEVSLPDEPIEDLVGDVAGVKRHADGDYVDTTQLEGKRIKISRDQIRKIVREERDRLVREQHPRAAADDRYVETLEAVEELVGKRNVSIVPGNADDEVYIMTGASEGVTVRVLRRGR